MIKITNTQLKDILKTLKKEQNDTSCIIPLSRSDMICKIWKTSTGAKLATIPRKSNINKGDYVKITKVETQ